MLLLFVGSRGWCWREMSEVEGRWSRARHDFDGLYKVKVSLEVVRFVSAIVSRWFAYLPVVAASKGE